MLEHVRYMSVEEREYERGGRRDIEEALHEAVWQSVQAPLVG